MCIFSWYILFITDFTEVIINHRIRDILDQHKQTAGSTVFISTKTVVWKKEYYNASTAGFAWYHCIDRFICIVSLSHTHWQITHIYMLNMLIWIHNPFIFL